MPTTLTISLDRKTGADLARCGEYHTRSARSSAARALARQLIAAGFDPGPFEARGEDGRLRYSGPSLLEFSKWTLAEEPRLRRVRFVPYGSPHWRRDDDSGEDDAPESRDPAPGEHVSAESVKQQGDLTCQP